MKSNRAATWTFRVVPQLEILGVMLDATRGTGAAPAYMVCELFRSRTADTRLAMDRTYHRPNTAATTVKAVRCASSWEAPYTLNSAAPSAAASAPIEERTEDEVGLGSGLGSGLGLSRVYRHRR